jgi:23S rRNA (adenine1618-N6)-methyltransferase
VQRLLIRIAMNKSKFKIFSKEKGTIHPRNKMLGGYDFDLLTGVNPNLTEFVILNPSGVKTIDFSNSMAVKALNTALLKKSYNINTWDVPTGYLVPPIPGRADHIHHLADMLASTNKDIIPIGRSMRIMDIGVGSSCVYPIIGSREYGWSFVGTDVDEDALKSARTIINADKELKDLVELRLQKDPKSVLKGVLTAEDDFDLIMCNPPFHATFEDMKTAVERKWNNLKLKPEGSPHLNFGGVETELIYPGGELAFVLRMAAESVLFKKNVYWFSSLISKEENLQPLYNVLGKMDTTEVRTVEMIHGQKKSRIVAWTFLTEYGQRGWREGHWWTAEPK